MDEYGFTRVNTNRFLASDEPYVLVSELQHVFYVEGLSEKNWHIVTNDAPCDF